MATEYCLSADVRKRLTEVGFLFTTDANRDQWGSPAEIAAVIDTSIVYAGNVIDGNLCEQINPTTARGQANAWLKDRCIDLACQRVVSTGGQEMPKTLQEAYDFSIDELERVRLGARIPNYIYPTPANAPFIKRLPMVVNPTRRR